MELCSDNHEEICYEGKECPLCNVMEKKDELENKIEDLDMKIVELNEKIEGLNDEIGNYKTDT